MTEPSEVPAAQRALVVTAHPDDVDFGASGTVATWTSTGLRVAYCVCTSGEATGDPDLPRDAVAQQREREQIAAAAELGVSDTVFLRHPDGRLVPSLELRRDITRIIRQLRPHRVLTWSPEINWEQLVTSHPDHRAAGEATLAAVYPDARNPHSHPELLRDEGLVPWTVEELWVADGPMERRNEVVDVTEVFPITLAALWAHRSQTEHIDDLAERRRAWLSGTARRFGLPDGRLAEAFQVVQTG
ncbi:PIG-L deacetylase family protein [Longimycelium tulufanense]|nr:PIG-L deacetylase family protein [Longimycelium tulufanense]